MRNHLIPHNRSAQQQHRDGHHHHHHHGSTPSSCATTTMTTQPCGMRHMFVVHGHGQSHGQRSWGHARRVHMQAAPSPSSPLGAPPAGARGNTPSPSSSQPSSSSAAAAGAGNASGGGVTSSSVSSAGTGGGVTSLPVRLIGVGPRAAGVLGRLGDTQVGVCTDVHYVDWDLKQLEGGTLSPHAHRALLQAPPTSNMSDATDDVSLEAFFDTADVDRMCGPVVFEDGSAGCAVVFIIASAADGPTGTPRAIAELARALRNAGHFTVAVLTLPFEFEGTKKSEAGGALVEQLQDIAHTTITIEQALLTDNTLGLNITAAQAIAIADGALEHAVRGVAAALRVPELLVLSNGGAAWHGKARGNLRQRMSTPLQQLLTRPGTFALGRGLAGLQHAAAASLPGSTTGADATALQCMAADAVAAAADSPFLQGGLKDAAGLLCCISLPGEVGGGFGGGGVGGKGGKGGTAARLAVQAAAGSLMEALGSAPVAKNMLICAHHVPVDAVEGSNQQQGLAVEATIMIVRPPLGNHALPSTRIQMAPPPPKSKAVIPPARRNPTAPTSSGGGAGPPGGARLPSSVWGAMSALAGGTAAPPAGGVGGAQTPPASSTRGRGATKGGGTVGSGGVTKTGGASPLGGTVTPAPANKSNAPMIGRSSTSGGGGQQPPPPAASNVVPKPPTTPLPPPRTRPLLRPDQLPSQTTNVVGSSGVGGKNTTQSAPSPNSTIGDVLAKSLNVRSLDLPRHTPDAPPQWPDLPPRAAIWRMQQRPVLEVTEEVEDEGGAMSGWLPWATGRKQSPHPPSQASARAWSILGEEGEED